MKMTMFYPEKADLSVCWPYFILVLILQQSECFDPSQEQRIATSLSHSQARDLPNQILSSGRLHQTLFKNGDYSTKELPERAHPSNKRRRLEKRNAIIASLFKGIFPGTIWCGKGSLSTNKTEVGFFNSTDSCCREHDSCLVQIGAGQQVFGLFNDGRYTISHCECDEKFRRCLQGVGSLTASSIGNIYFNVLKTPCFVLKTVFDEQQNPVNRQAFLLRQRDFSQDGTRQNSVRATKQADVRETVIQTLLKGGAMAARMAVNALASGLD